MCVSRKTVSRWAQQLQAGGAEALLSRRQSGRKARLEAYQWQQVLETLQEGTPAAGFEIERWTLWRIQWVIRERFGVCYNTHYLSQKLRQSGWSVQKPAVYARERSDELVQAWLRGDWPRIQQRLADWEQR